MTDFSRRTGSTPHDNEMEEMEYSLDRLDKVSVYPGSHSFDCASSVRLSFADYSVLSAPGFLWFAFVAESENSENYAWLWFFFQFGCVFSRHETSQTFVVRQPVKRSAVRSADSRSALDNAPSPFVFYNNWFKKINFRFLNHPLRFQHRLLSCRPQRFSASHLIPPFCNVFCLR